MVAVGGTEGEGAATAAETALEALGVGSSMHTQARRHNRADRSLRVESVQSRFSSWMSQRKRHGLGQPDKPQRLKLGVTHR